MGMVMENEKTSKKISKKAALLIIVSVAVIIILIAVIIILSNCKNPRREEVNINDDFFRSDNSKIVMPIGDDNYAADNSRAKQMYEVFNVDGEKIVSAYLYMEFENEAYAKGSLESEETASAINAGVYKNNGKTEGKYVILELPEETYSGVPASDLRTSVKNYEETIERVKEENENLEDESDDYTYIEGDEDGDGVILISNPEE